MLRNLSAQEVRIPPNKTVISNAQAANIVHNIMVPPNIQVEPFLQLNRKNCYRLASLPAKLPQSELTWPTPVSLQLEPGDPALEHAVLDKVDLLGCANWDPKDQQEVIKLLNEYVDVFA